MENNRDNMNEVKRKERRRIPPIRYIHIAAIILIIIMWINIWREGRNDDWASSIQQTRDGGYIVAGGKDSFFTGKANFYIIKLDEEGNKEWERTYGGEDWDGADSIQQTRDGGYIVAGGTHSFGAGETDFYIIKLDMSGNKEWEKTYGGGKDDEAYSIQQTKDEGYIAAGYTESFAAGEKDFYIIKLDINGNKVWERTYGGEKFDKAYSIQQTRDGGYIVAGLTWSFGSGGDDFYIIKLDEEGNKVWERTYGGKSRDEAYSIQQTRDGGYIVAGGGMVSSFGVEKITSYIIKLDGNGNKEWEYK